MDGLCLPDHVRYCEIGPERIFLDLESDRYFSLPPKLHAAFSAVLGGAASSADIEALRAIGLLIDSPAGRPLRPTSHPVPQNSFIEDEEVGRGCSPLLLAEVLCLVLSARHAVRRRRMPQLLSGPAAAPAPCHAGCPERRGQAVAAFLRARPALPVAPNCLYDSLALRCFLARRAIAVDLVIGTRLHPFEAHCWLQHGTTVLNDSLAAARGFTPILAA